MGIEIKYHLSGSSPPEATTKLFQALASKEINTSDLAEAFQNQPTLPNAVISGATNLAANLISGAKASQSAQVQNLLSGYQSALDMLKPLSSKLETPEERIRFAEIIASMSKDYFEVARVINHNNNEFWRYATGGVLATLVAVVGSRNYLATNAQYQSRDRGSDDFK